MSKDEVIELFPFRCSETTIFYLDKIISHKDYDWYVSFYDNDGYKYQTTIESILRTKRHKSQLSRFFKRNPFTSFNIQHFLDANEISMKLLEDKLFSGNSRDLLSFIDKNNNIIKLSWNQLQTNTHKYKDDVSDATLDRMYTFSMTKDDVIKKIYEIQSNLDRPINAYDFRKKQNGGIGIRLILKYWDEVRFMQEELGLEITGKYSHILSDEECLCEIEKICNLVHEEENRKTITINDIKKYGTYNDAKPYSNVCKSNNTTLSQYIKSLGFELQRAGIGFNHIFENGERVVSKYEYEFSNYLNNIKLTYNKDYYRDVKYKTLTTEYKGNMNCDYEIHFQGRIFYVELAGMLGNVGHEKCYRENIPINSKSKEKYRLGLMHKKSIFEKEKLEYYILLPSEMNEETYKQILESKYK